MGKNTYTINDLPRFSPWPERLLGLNPWEPRKKTPEEVIREYERDKWGPLLAKVQQRGGEVTVEEVDDWICCDLPATLRSIGDQLVLLSSQETHRQYKALITSVIEPYLSRSGPKPIVIELGAGYGSIILGLAKERAFNQAQFIAAEYVDSGIELIKILARKQKLDIKVGRCDLTAPQIVDFPIPANAIIFTSMAIHYVPRLPKTFVKSILSMQPAAVINIEPCFEHFQGNTLLDVMRRRYVELNDYNTNLVTLLKEYQKKGAIKILGERPAVFGNNPLLPVSIVSWVPADKINLW